MLRFAPLILVAAFLAACGQSSGRSDETCLAVPGACGNKTLESCCAAGNQCRYVVSDGTEFPCDGSDCNDAANKATAYCQNQ